MARPKKTKSSQLAKAIDLFQAGLKALKDFHENLDPFLLDSEKLKEIRPLIENLMKAINPEKAIPVSICVNCLYEGRADKCNDASSIVENAVIISCPVFISKEKAETPGAETPGAETPGAETPGAETPGAETPGIEPTGKSTDDGKNKRKSKKKTSAKSNKPGQ